MESEKNPCIFCKKDGKKVMDMCNCILCDECFVRRAELCPICVRDIKRNDKRKYRDWDYWDCNEPRETY